MKTKHTREVVEVVLIVALLLGVFVFIRPQITGMAVGETNQTTLEINQVFNQSSELNLSLEGNLTSLAVSGSYSGERVQIYLDELLVYSSDASGNNRISDNLVGTNETAKNVTDQTELNLTNPDVNQTNTTEQVINQSANESISNTKENISRQLVSFSNECEETCLLENYPSNTTLRIIVENATLNLSSITYTYRQFEEENIALNLTENLTTELNATQNITTNVSSPNATENITYEEFNHTEVKVGEPVTWLKRVKDVKTVTLPGSAYNIQTGDDVKVDIGDRKLSVEEFSRLKAGKPKEMKLELNTTKEVEISYQTPGPEKTEKEISKYKKQVIISSDIHYKNILASTEIEESPREAITVYWIKDSGKEKVENVQYIDSNNNNLIDMLEWTVPHLSNQIYEISITILNPYTYLRDGETWTVAFNTTGIANLTITSPNAGWTEFLTDDPDTFDEMEFLDIKCGEESLKDELKLVDFQGNMFEYNELESAISLEIEKLLVEDYSCDNTGYLSNYMHKAGYATLLFEFKSHENSVTDYAYDPEVLTMINVTDNASTISVGEKVMFTSYWSHPTGGKNVRLLIDDSTDFTNCNYNQQAGCIAYSSTDSTSPTQAEYTSQSGDGTLEWYAQICDEDGTCDKIIDYDFSDLTNKNAFEKNGTASSPTDYDNEATSTDYGNINESDNSRWVTEFADAKGEYDTQIFVFNISSKEPSMLNITWEGYGENESGYNTTLYAWDYNDSSWTQFDILDFTSLSDQTLNHYEASTPEAYVNTNGKVAFKVTTEKYVYMPDENNTNYADGCADGEDNDGDGYIDCADSDCYNTSTNLSNDFVYCGTTGDMWSETIGDSDWGKYGTYAGDCPGDCSDVSYWACNMCCQSSHGGFEDWYLPYCDDDDDLPDSCQAYQLGVDACGWDGGDGGQNTCEPEWDDSASSTYRTASEYSSTYAWLVRFGSGSVEHYYRSKNVDLPVRCVRSGSSPYIYTYNNNGYEFLSDFIGGATSSSREYLDFTDISQTQIEEDKIKLKITGELEETIYIDRIYLLVDGSEIVELSSITNANISMVQESDNIYLVMNRGDEHYLEFGAPENYTKLEFAAEGYYIKHPDKKYREEHNSLYTDYVKLETYGSGEFDVNEAPTITTPTFSPSTAYTDDNIKCNATPTDTENNTLSVEYKWYNCTASCAEHDSGENTGLSNGSNAVISTLSSSDTSKDDVWNCSVRSFDGNSYSDWKSAEITIQNSAPAWDETISEYALFHNESMSLQLNVTDADNDDLTWDVNDSIVNIDQSGQITDNPSISDRGTHAVQANVTDGTDTATMNFIYEVKNYNPTYTLNYPPTGARGIDYNVTLNVTVTDAESDNTNVTFLDKIQSMCVGQYYTCGILENRSLMCWGYNAYGQTGIGSDSPDPVTSPRYVDFNGRFIDVACGQGHTCGLLENGSVLCWGANGYGQLGLGYTSSEEHDPQYVDGPSNFTTISAGEDTTCGILINGSGMCWGWNTYSQTGIGNDNSPVNSPSYVAGERKFVEIAPSSYRHTMGLLENGSAMCWGQNYDSQCGAGSSSPGEVQSPIYVNTTNQFISVSAGKEYSCGLMANGSAMCWGSNFRGKTGIGSLSPSEIEFPTYVNTTHRFKYLRAHGDTTCGVLLNGSAVCWGGNPQGNTGIGSTTPLEVVNVSYVNTTNRFIQIFPGDDTPTTCGILVNGSAMCWGWNSDAQTGIGSTTPSPLLTPSYVVATGQFVNFSVKGNNTDVISGSEATTELKNLPERTTYLWSVLIQDDYDTTNSLVWKFRTDSTCKEMPSSCFTGSECCTGLCVNGNCATTCDMESGIGCSTDSTDYDSISAGTCYDSSAYSSGGTYGCDYISEIRMDCGTGNPCHIDEDDSFESCSSTSGDGCDSNAGGNFTQDGTCTASGCDTSGHVCYDDVSFQSDCSTCYSSGSDWDACDSSVLGGDYDPDGICVSGGVCDNSGEACYDGSAYQSSCTSCSEGNACDSSIESGSYSANGVCYDASGLLCCNSDEDYEGSSTNDCCYDGSILSDGSSSSSILCDSGQFYDCNSQVSIDGNVDTESTTGSQVGSLCCGEDNSWSSENCNTNPEITTPTFSPTTAYTDDDISCNATPTDGENSTLTVEWFWYNGTEEMLGGNTTGLTDNVNAVISTLGSGNTTKDETWNCTVRTFDGELYSDWSSAEITLQNSQPTVNLLTPTNGNTSIRTRRPEFTWSGSDGDSDSLTYNIWIDDNSDFSSPAIDGVETQDQNYTPTSDLELDTQYFWRVQAYDGTDYVNSSDWNFTTESYIEVKFINESISFGSMNLSETKNTTSDDPYPFVLQNMGNVFVNVTFGVTGAFWDSALAPLDTSFLQFKADERTEANSFDYAGSQTTWMNLSTENKTLVKDLNYSDSNDEVVVDILIRVPEDEPAGSKSTTFVIEIP